MLDAQIQYLRLAHTGFDGHIHDPGKHRVAVAANSVEEYLPEYVRERSPQWAEHHIAAHRKLIQAGGEPRKRSPKLTEPGPLASLASIRLVDLNMERLEAWARIEALSRPSSARLAMRLLKACLNWCSVHPTYSAVVTSNAAKSTKVRETLGKPKLKHDLLQREQLAAWFSSVQKIGNPVIAAYLQNPSTYWRAPRRACQLAVLHWARQ